MQFGFGKVDITPRVGVGLYGYGPFLTRHSIGVRTPLYARAIAFSDGGATGVLVSCDLVGVSGDVTERVRQRVREAVGLGPESVCVHCVHTHSGPRTKFGIGQGLLDPPYMEILPVRIARACIDAVNSLEPATLRHAVVPCVGLGYNREDDERPSLEEALSDDWRPALPERTDTEAHVLRVDTQAGLRGFASYFSCHPVVGPSCNRYIHSDFVGVATNSLERERPGAIGLFLQGCEGNTNSCVVHHDEQASLLALDVLGARYARQIRPGLETAEPMCTTPVRVKRTTCRPSRAPLPEEQLRAELARQEEILYAPEASDADWAVRKATVVATAIRKELARIEAGEDFPQDVELHGMRLGDLLLLGAPFEVMIAYKQRIQAAFDNPTLVLSLCNDTLGYAPERKSYAMEGNYGAQTVPYMLGYPPYTPDLEDELVAAMTELGKELMA